MRGSNGLPPAWRKDGRILPIRYTGLGFQVPAQSSPSQIMKSRSKALKSKRGNPLLKGGGNPERPTRIVESARTTKRKRRKQHPEIVTSQTILRPTNVAAYVRTATQRHHLASDQMDVIRKYAKRHGMQIVKEYSDEGKSGVNIQDREALAQMIRDVQSGQINFSGILLFDVSRWGRFQDADESAYYEYICRRAGVLVHYCAEDPECEGIVVSTIVKSIKKSPRENENGH